MQFICLQEQQNNSKIWEACSDTQYGAYTGLIREVCGILIQDTELSPAPSNWAHLMNMEKAGTVSTSLASRPRWPPTYVCEKRWKYTYLLAQVWHQHQLVIYFYLFLILTSTAFFSVPVISAIQAKSVWETCVSWKWCEEENRWDKLITHCMFK